MRTINTGFVLLAMALASQASPFVNPGGNWAAGLDPKCQRPGLLRPLDCPLHVVNYKRQDDGEVDAGIGGGPAAFGAAPGKNKVPPPKPKTKAKPPPTKGPQPPPTKVPDDPKTPPATKPTPTTKATDTKPTDPATGGTAGADSSRYKPTLDGAGKIVGYVLDGTNTVISVAQFAQMFGLFGGGQESSSALPAPSSAPAPAETVPTSAEGAAASAVSPPAPPAPRGIDEQILERGLFGPWEWIWDGTKMVAHVIDNKFGEDKGQNSGEGGEADQGAAPSGAPAPN
ncbi:hypothetical protein BDZ89DRAFT_1041563 [Hymenopellis radicata]|nr:hypothetical protein BDZ89DRAFT_1041563 [Hymenopellis radicata]